MQNNSLSMAKKRLEVDLKKIEKENDEGIDAGPAEDNIFEWEAHIYGPSGSPWQDGIFQLKITYPEDYPNKPPKVVFQSKMYHPNIYSDGRICLDILDKAWKPVYDTWAILTSIRSLLCDPNPNSPANGEAASLYKLNRTQYDKKVKEVVLSSLKQ